MVNGNVAIEGIEEGVEVDGNGKGGGADEVGVEEGDDSGETDGGDEKTGSCSCSILLSSWNKLWSLVIICLGLQFTLELDKHYQCQSLFL